MALSIVTVNVTQTVAEAPLTLQQTFAAVSNGSTNTAVGTLTMLTQASSLTAILNGTKSISTMTWSGGTVTVTAAAAHGIPVGDTEEITIAGASPTAYNGTYLATATTTTAFTYPLVSSPGSYTSGASYTLADVSELTAMVATWFAQGNANALYVLEVGEGITAGITELGTYISTNLYTIYGLILPSEWDSNSALLSLIASYENTTAKIYFFITTTTANYTNYTQLMKCVVTMIQAPAAPTTEFSIAAMAWVICNYAPSSINLVTPTAFSYVYGVTAYPTVGNATLRTTLKAAGVNIIGTGSEGGISNTILLWGTTMDLHDFTYWYSVDWVQLHLDEDISNAIINGSNNPQAPLYYNQNGINSLQAVAQHTMNRGVTFGLVLPPVVVNAVSFQTYVAANPSDYPVGKYAGLSVTYTPNRGFIAITIGVQVSAFPIA